MYPKEVLAAMQRNPNAAQREITPIGLISNLLSE